MSEQFPSFDHPAVCPWCGVKHDAAVGVTGRNTPKKGDLSLCIKCGEWGQFNVYGKVVKPTQKAYDFIASSMECRAVRAAWLDTQKRHAP